MQIITVISKIYGTKLIKVDDEDFEQLNQYRWYVYPRDNTFYARRVVHSGGKKSWFKMHRDIMKLAPEVSVDHRDGDGLNNQKANLRAATHAQNMANRKSHKNSTS